MRNTVPTHKQSKKSGYDMPTMMLLIGMKISFTKKPMKPMIAKPTDVACAILENSAQGARGGSAQPGSDSRIEIWRLAARRRRPAQRQAWAGARRDAKSWLRVHVRRTPVQVASCELRRSVVRAAASSSRSGAVLGAALAAPRCPWFDARMGSHRCGRASCSASRGASCRG